MINPFAKLAAVAAAAHGIAGLGIATPSLDDAPAPTPRMPRKFRRFKTAKQHCVHSKNSTPRIRKYLSKHSRVLPKGRIA